jgi:hypothetical protein
VISKVAGWLLLVAVVLVAVAVTFPSVKPVDLLAGLGVFSLAIGFAFQDILENTLSGILLLFRQPFRSGDQIQVMDQVGTVEEINIRETRMTTFDGELVVVPNRDVYKNVIVVFTHGELRRQDFVVGVAFESDTEEATRGHRRGPDRGRRGGARPGTVGVGRRVGHLDGEHPGPVLVEPAGLRRPARARRRHQARQATPRRGRDRDARRRSSCSRRRRACRRRSATIPATDDHAGGWRATRVVAMSSRCRDWAARCRTSLGLVRARQLVDRSGTGSRSCRCCTWRGRSSSA